eukprot:TRINITY_DN16683_c0_g2_i1.p1 TRINITY_DN16683_c0_g2~~TRINITY_DN16683_c0_g2_i1.p1  ORF type:complete len:132 (+),score=34.12 TRINITY_DN16683_c0_g2_i1:28-423(+)
MSLAVLKRELDKEVEAMDAKKKKVEEKGKKKSAQKKKINALKKSSFNTKDYTKEDDYTDICIQNLVALDNLVDVETSKIRENVAKSKRQLTEAEVAPEKETGSIFTDADFDVVNRLYFVNSKRAVILDEEK